MKRRDRIACVLVHLVWGGLFLTGVGCSRTFYRLQADREAYQLVQEKLDPARWPLPNYSVVVDPRSRMYDPFSPDAPPMPPDDPTSHRLMHYVDGKKGYPAWHINGDTNVVESPNWLSYLPTDERGMVVLDADRAVQLARLHSPLYQQEVEDLYLSALDVSFERFRFDHQFFAGYGTLYTADGRARNGTGESSSVLNTSTFPVTRGFRMQKFSTTGAEFVVGFANSLVWQFAGPNDYTPTSLLDFNLVQPLLRSAGRDRIMERLTIAERTLLANVRQMERFQRGFYLQVLTGLTAGAGPSRRGGFFGGSGLDGFSGVGGGGFGGVGSSSGFAGGGGGTGGAGAQDAGGFVGLLQDRLQIRNQEANIASLRSSLAQLQAFFEAGRIDYFQVELARQALFNAESRLLNARATYFATLDTFKYGLGLPPQLPVEVRDPMLDGFDLIDPGTVPLQIELTQIQEQVGLALSELLKTERGTVGPGGPAPLPEPDRLSADRVEALREWLKKAEYLRGQLESAALVRAKADIDELQQAIPERRSQWRNLRLQIARDEELGGTDLRSAQWVAEDELRELPGELSHNLTELARRLQEERGRFAIIDQHLIELQQRCGTGTTPLDAQARATLQELPNELNVLSSNTLEVILTQARARTESLTLVPVHMDWTEALEIARQNRLDWMNARAALVDSWRLIEFNADDLESRLDLVFSGDIGNVGDNPFRFRDTTGRLRVGVQFDAPITRLSERNTYRQALIEYQQARRNYYRFQDQVVTVLRGTLRNMRLNHMNFELRRAAVQVAITQVELSRLRLQEPPRPNVEFSFGATTARDLVTALSDLLSVQNDFLSVWVNHEVLRRSLDFNLGTMQLDGDGVWLDPGPVLGSEAIEELPPPTPESSVSAAQVPERNRPVPLLVLPSSIPQLASTRSVPRTPGDLVRLPLPPEGPVRWADDDRTTETSPHIQLTGATMAEGDAANAVNH